MNISGKKLFVWLCIVFIITLIWADPHGMGPKIGGFLGDVGHFVMVVTQKLSDFLSGLGNG